MKAGANIQTMVERELKVESIFFLVATMGLWAHIYLLGNHVNSQYIATISSPLPAFFILAEQLMKILVVDDHPLFGDALVAIVSNELPESKIFRAESCSEAIKISNQVAIDLCLLDLTLIDTSGIDSLIKFREGSPSTPTVVVSAHEQQDIVGLCLACGAIGFMPKTGTRDQLMKATHTVLSGKIYVPDIRMERASSNMQTRLSELGLTLRQQEVFRAVLLGKPNKVISQELGISESTIKKHVSPALKALGVIDRVQAIVKLAERGIVVD